MFKKILETIISGAIGLGVLYAVARVAFEAGEDMAQAKQDYEAYTAHKKNCVEADPDDHEEHNDEPGADEAEVLSFQRGRKPGKLGTFMMIRKAFGRGKNSVLGDLMNDPEDHKLEAYVKEGEVHINIKKRRSLTPATVV